MNGSERRAGATPLRDAQRDPPARHLRPTGVAPVMKNLVAIVNVVTFWVFGYLTLTATGLSDAQLAIFALLSFAGLLTGVSDFMRIVHGLEVVGYAQSSIGLNPGRHSRSQMEWGH